MMLDFLNGLVNVPKANNTLEKFLWRTLRSNEMVGLLRVCTLFKLVLTDAMRWLTGKAKKLDDWSIVSASRVLELAEEALIAIAADGRKLLDPVLEGDVRLSGPEIHDLSGSGDSRSAGAERP